MSSPVVTATGAPNVGKINISLPLQRLKCNTQVVPVLAYCRSHTTVYVLIE
jgi:hypothetical protein